MMIGNNPSRGTRARKRTLLVLGLLLVGTVRIIINARVPSERNEHRMDAYDFLVAARSGVHLGADGARVRVLIAFPVPCSACHRLNEIMGKALHALPDHISVTWLPVLDTPIPPTSSDGRSGYCLGDVSPAAPLLNSLFQSQDRANLEELVIGADCTEQGGGFSAHALEGDAEWIARIAQTDAPVVVVNTKFVEHPTRVEDILRYAARELRPARRERT